MPTYYNPDQVITNTDELEIGNFNVHPNPTRENLHIYSNESGFVSIYDVFGKLILQKTILTNYDVIDVSELSSGIYLLRFDSDNARKTTKFIKE